MRLKKTAKAKNTDIYDNAARKITMLFFSLIYSETPAFIYTVLPSVISRRMVSAVHCRSRPILLMVVMSFSHSNLCHILPFPRYFNFASTFLEGRKQNVLELSVRTCVRAYLSGRRHSVTGSPSASTRSLDNEKHRENAQNLFTRQKTSAVCHWHSCSVRSHQL